MVAPKRAAEKREVAAEPRHLLDQQPAGHRMPGVGRGEPAEAEAGAGERVASPRHEPSSTAQKIDPPPRLMAKSLRPKYTRSSGNDRSSPTRASASTVSTRMPAPARPAIKPTNRATSAGRVTIGRNTPSAPAPTAASTSEAVWGPNLFTRHHAAAPATVATDARSLTVPGRISVSKPCCRASLPRHYQSTRNERTPESTRRPTRSRS
jgi:hypothetical protein